MSQSPQQEVEVDVEQTEQTPEDSDAQNKDLNRSDDDPNLAYDFEVKEQDRWLPIANGMYDCSSFLTPPCCTRNPALVRARAVLCVSSCLFLVSRPACALFRTCPHLCHLAFLANGHH